MELKEQREIEKWYSAVSCDCELKTELEALREDKTALHDAFYRDLEFGTGGLRGIIGVGTNRMNIFTVGRATQGLANYLINKIKNDNISVAISYDSRIKSDIFASTAARVLAANGIKAYIFSELMPTPCLSFAVRRLKCDAGIMVTASHNPAKYNGYKVYGADGCQITDIAAGEILSEILNVDVFSGVSDIDFETAVKSGNIEYISDNIVNEYIKCVSEQRLQNDTDIDKQIKICYSALNGAGAKPVIMALKANGFNNLVTVDAQMAPDGTFPTCPYPNPENPKAMTLGIDTAKKHNAEIFIATDPDCDRVGACVRDGDGYTQLSGNEMGVLLLDYICSSLGSSGAMPQNPLFIKTIVTTNMAEKIANDYNVKTANVLTGFKYIGEQIGKLEEKGCTDNFIFGFEESYGYLRGAYVRDKDAVVAALLICEMVGFYKKQNISLLEKLKELYEKYGYCKNNLYTYELEGESGDRRIKEIMNTLRNGLAATQFNYNDYSLGLDNLPKSNVLEIVGKDYSFIIRPSGTEPKIKIYTSITAESFELAYKKEKQMINKFINKFEL